MLKARKLYPLKYLFLVRRPFIFISATCSVNALPRNFCNTALIATSNCLPFIRWHHWSPRKMYCNRFFSKKNSQCSFLGIFIQRWLARPWQQPQQRDRSRHWGQRRGRRLRPLRTSSSDKQAKEPFTTTNSNSTTEAADLPSISFSKAIKQWTYNDHSFVLQVPKSKQC